jgi:hypothetical protein
MSLGRQFMTVRERLQLSVRGSDSIFNHQNWRAANTSVFSPSFAKMFGKSNPTTLQLGGKLAF